MLFAADHEIDIPSQDHPLDERSRELLGQYQSQWRIIE